MRSAFAGPGTFAVASPATYSGGPEVIASPATYGQIIPASPVTYGDFGGKFRIKLFGKKVKGKAIKDILVGSILWVTWPTIIRLAIIYAVVGLVHLALRHRFLTISFEPETAVAHGWRIRWWDFLFYLTFGVVITFSVPIAGVLLVFSFLVVPAAIAFQFTENRRVMAVIAWIAGLVASALGIGVSFRYDLPTGPLIVVMFGLLLVVSLVLGRLRRAA